MQAVEKKKASYIHKDGKQENLKPWQKKKKEVLSCLQRPTSTSVSISSLPNHSGSYMSARQS